MCFLNFFRCKGIAEVRKSGIFATQLSKTVVVAQLVRASDCGSEGRGFETRLPPLSKGSVSKDIEPFLYFIPSLYLVYNRTFKGSPAKVEEKLPNSGSSKILSCLLIFENPTFRIQGQNEGNSDFLVRKESSSLLGNMFQAPGTYFPAGWNECPRRLELFFDRQQNVKSAEKKENRPLQNKKMLIAEMSKYLKMRVCFVFHGF